MQIIKEKLKIDEVLERKINNILKFNNIKATIKTGNIISLTNTNLAYIEPHKFEINGVTYLLFNDSDIVFINDLNCSIPLTDLDKHIRNTK